jgi:hypothetical protein
MQNLASPLRIFGRDEGVIMFLNASLAYNLKT